MSSATREFSPEELEAMLVRARDKNHARGITGLLVHRGGNFTQYIEGETEAVRNLYATIQRDPRHHGAIILSEGPLRTRQFAGWDMNLRRVGAGPLFGPDELADDPEGIKAILNAFVENSR